MMKIKRKKTTRFRSLKFWLSSILALVLLTASGYAIYLHFQPAAPGIAVLNKPASTKPGVSGEKKTVKQKLSYSVPANHPRELTIKKLGIDANILPMGVLNDGSLEAPKTAWDVGWYNQSSLPGTGSGALLIDGHVNDALNTPGVFYDIRTLVPGDTLQIQRGDSKTFTYQVVKVQQQPLEKVDMAAMLRSVQPDKQGLNLITCGGTYDPERKTYDDRVLVFAVQTD